MRFSIVPFLLLAMPIAEIAVFILVGQQIGLLPTLGLILFTAVLGAILLRVQGFGLLQRISSEAQAGRVPGRELVHGVMILVAGVLLLTPGFVTDTLGFLLFIPAVRDLGWRLVRDRVIIVAHGMGGRRARGSGRGPGHGGPGEPVIDLDEADFERNPSPDSPWRSEDKPGPERHRKG